ncbi:hypothetical protein RBA41_08980 [Massilia sp. CCM 9210]|uniref:hypothetical protein n=1 Tax=Massilia scottii TaxID=3057166 RepID=UPI0027967D65|nr:hypothetical protein [Massilia sp. CCM 9210]MDQ1813436.1 hypothetical protein [Massilia sp. CCM 9210]
MDMNDATPALPTSALRWSLLLLIGLLFSLAGMRPASAAPYWINLGSTISSPKEMSQQEVMTSPSGEYFLITQTDGNLCVYRDFDNSGVWCSRSSSAGEAVYRTAMKTDGNLCTVNANGNNAWCRTNSGSEGNYFLKLKDDANLCVSRGTPAAPLGEIWCSGVTAASQNRQKLTYGTIYHLQNNYQNWSGGYLDVRGAGCGNMLCVSTSYWPERSSESTGSWAISGIGNPATGTPVMPNDVIFLQNQYINSNLPSGTYLETRNKGCEFNVFCLSTSQVKDTGNSSTRWAVMSARNYVWVGQPVSLMTYPTGSFPTYLDTRGYSCSDNLQCASTSGSNNRDSGSGTWRFLYR